MILTNASITVRKHLEQRALDRCALQFLFYSDVLLFSELTLISLNLQAVFSTGAAEECTGKFP